MKADKPTRLSIVGFAILALLFTVQCEHSLGPAPMRDEFPYPVEMAAHQVNELALDERFYNWDSIFPLDLPYLQDDDGASLFLFNGRQYYHPVQLAQRTLIFLDSYRDTGEQEYLAKCEAHLQKLLDLGVESKDALYFYYPFDFPLHGNPDETLRAPWYSGMAQGQALSAFVRMYQITGETSYYETADRIFRSYLVLPESDLPWTVFIDEEDFYWIEEYPWQVTTQVLNGFIFGFYGLYDYYFEKGDNTSYKLMQASLTTLKRYLEAYRRPGDISVYCLRHEVQSASYHEVHIRELRMLYKITGDPFFDQMATLFLRDHP